MSAKKWEENGVYKIHPRQVACHCPRDSKLQVAFTVVWLVLSNQQSTILSTRSGLMDGYKSRTGYDLCGKGQSPIANTVKKNMYRKLLWCTQLVLISQQFTCAIIILIRFLFITRRVIILLILYVYFSILFKSEHVKCVKCLHSNNVTLLFPSWPYQVSDCIDLDGNQILGVINALYWKFLLDWSIDPLVLRESQLLNMKAWCPPDRS